ncbi:MAG: hypothetical protein KJ587_11950 [Alphaproteobacteria bacterium]|nr:hypothetical protein [Alphaproteobacteria bacterium]
MSQIGAPEQRSFLPMLLAGLIVLASAGLLWHALGRPIETSPLSAKQSLNAGFRPAEATATGHRMMPAAHRKADLSETLARPLFRNTRRPYVAQVEVVERVAATVPAKPKAAPPPQFPDGLKLVGIVELPGTKPAALMRFKDLPDGLKVFTGDDVQGWKISDISGETVTLIAGESRRVMSLSD